ncbi:MAG: hypothetical protein ABFD52_08955 [Acidobacteriota bacterium]
MRRSKREPALVLVGLGIILVFALGLVLGAKVERAAANLNARQIAGERIVR